MQVLYEDNHLIIVNKNNNDLVQGDKTGDIALDRKVKEYLKKKYNKQGEAYLGVVHRIDRPVSGVVLFAKTGKALSRLNKMLQEKKITKTYWAIVKNKPNPDVDFLKHYLVRNPKKNKSFAYETRQENSRLAELSFSCIANSDNYYLLEIQLHTGRHHQIRSQLSKIGSPIKGDLKYGFPRSNKDGGISLHARKIEFIHPVSEKNINVTANTPEEKLWQFFENFARLNQ
ncbi:MAG: RluA family pseudouridine synthase [Bacteroidales bacterium]